MENTVADYTQIDHTQLEIRDGVLCYVDGRKSETCNQRSE